MLSFGTLHINESVFYVLVQRGQHVAKRGACLAFHVKVLSKFAWLPPSGESLVATS